MFSGKKVLIIGLARSGRAAALFLAHRGAKVTVADIKPREELSEFINGLENHSIEIVAGGYPPVSKETFDLVIVSPAVPLIVRPVVEAKKEGIPVWSELELAGYFIKEPLIAVTGTNGKTTTTSLIGHILQEAGKRVNIGGNIGIPLIHEVSVGSAVDYWVAEVSSFQLEAISAFRPHIGVFLNLTPDHLDRHDSLKNYGQVKLRLFENQDRHDFAVLNRDDPYLQSLPNNFKSRVFWFSRKDVPDWGIGVKGGQMLYKLNGSEEFLANISELRIPGPHNLENALAAAAVCLLLGITPEMIRQGLYSFPGVPHRLELVKVIRGIKFVNDSKGTNPDSVLRALDAFPVGTIVLIAGGRSKGCDFTTLAKAIKEKVKAVVLLGEAKSLIKEALFQEGYDHVREVSSLSEALQAATKMAHSGDTVLLSPACASWDMFRDFEERGECFRKLVSELEGRECF